MFIEPTITWVPSGFSGYIWLDTKTVLKKKTHFPSHPLSPNPQKTPSSHLFLQFSLLAPCFHVLFTFTVFDHSPPSTQFSPSSFPRSFWHFLDPFHNLNILYLVGISVFKHLYEFEDLKISDILIIIIIYF